MQSNMSSAYSDDGQRHRIRRVDDLNVPSEQIEPDTGVSITAELSEHRQLVFGWFIFKQVDPKWDRPPATS